ncbi:uncharacterized protein Dmoj_GI26106 [Drosophila mojavensis]|uniref:BPTI/Kunitz inhibitor domain-containing protein n=1 Tax=Drosophila mojavensis TaxID=7230 RepID=A0A0Q9XHH5_DROMO|nr:uncharacterized protein Dmoj_GI26106 [Drosophila mojavensis]
MKCYVWPMIGILLLFIHVCYSYNAKICDAEPSKTGPCRAMFTMWRFIKAKKLCESFIYGGCQGTKNLFDSEKECKKNCLK